jgi:hypothetical protein
MRASKEAYLRANRIYSLLRRWFLPKRLSALLPRAASTAHGAPGLKQKRQAELLAVSFRRPFKLPRERHGLFSA